MIYTCDKCLFTFERDSEVDTCPDCGKAAVRAADENEKDEFQKNLSYRSDKN